jgi:fatty acid desaturase
MSLEGQVADEEFESEDLEVEPYAEDMPYEPRVRVPRWLLVGIIIVLIVALLVLMAIAFARGSWWYPPQPTGTSVPFFPLVP